MRKVSLLYMTLLFFSIGFAQKEQNNDTIKREVVEIISSYSPKLSDAHKIKIKPNLNIGNSYKRSKLDYSIKSVPVASTFVPKGGKMKVVKVQKREVVYNNYLAVGIGNPITPVIDANLYSTNRFQYQYSINAKFKMSVDPVKNSTLNSSYYNAGINAYYNQYESFYDWKIGLSANRNQYNWFGIPSNLNLYKVALDNIDPTQTYNDYNIYAQFKSEEIFLNRNILSVRYFTDRYDSSEIELKNTTQLSFSLGSFDENLSDVKVNLYNEFSLTQNNNYNNEQQNKYTYFSSGVHPFYKFNFNGVDVRIGGKGYFTMNFQNNKNHFLLYPDFLISVPLSESMLRVYLGALGDLKTNSLKELSEANPYIAPTVIIAQTNKMYDFFGGFKGTVLGKLNYNFSGNYTNEQNKPFFMLYPSRLRTNLQPIFSDKTIKGYQYGNSFNVLYDNIKTVSFKAELEYESSTDLLIRFSGEYYNYQTSNFDDVYNLPNIKANIYGRYNYKKWYGVLNTFFVGNRTGALYNGGKLSSINLDSYIDANINIGYNFTSNLSFFVKGDNLIGTNYQRFTNFNSHGIQIIGGVIWKFDSLF